MQKAYMIQESQKSELQELSQKLSAIVEGFNDFRAYVQGLKTVDADDQKPLVCLREKITDMLVQVYQANEIAVKISHPDLLCGCYPFNETDITFSLQGIRGVLEDLLEFTFWPEAEKFRPEPDEDVETDDCKETEQTADSQTLYDSITKRVYEQSGGHNVYVMYLCGLSDVAKNIAGISVNEQIQRNEDNTKTEKKQKQGKSELEMIPVEHRTLDISQTELAELYGKSYTQRSIKALITKGLLTVIKMSRQKFIFDKRELPPQVKKKLAEQF